MTTILTFVASTAFCFTPRLLSMPFINVDDPQNAQILELVGPLFIVQGTGLVADAIRNNCEGALCGFSDTKAPMLTAGLSMAIFLGAGYILGFPAKLDINGIFIARIVGIATAASLLMERWLYRSARAIQDGEIKKETGSFTRVFNSCHTFFSFRRRQETAGAQIVEIEEDSDHEQDPLITDETRVDKKFSVN
jgi:Na+-driven multidrug efflux pump